MRNTAGHNTREHPYLPELMMLQDRTKQEFTQQNSERQNITKYYFKSSIPSAQGLASGRILHNQETSIC